MPYLERLEAFQEGTDHRPDLGVGGCCEGSQGECQGTPGSRVAGEDWRASQEAAGLQSLNVGRVIYEDVEMEGRGVCITIHWCYPEAQGPWGIPGFQ